MPRGTALNKVYPSGGDSVGNAMHKEPRSGPGASMGTALGKKVMKGSPAPRGPIAHKRGPKPPSKALPKTPNMGKGRGAMAGQTTGKIV